MTLKTRGEPITPSPELSGGSGSQQFTGPSVIQTHAQGRRAHLLPCFPTPRCQQLAFQPFPQPASLPSGICGPSAQTFSGNWLRGHLLQLKSPLCSPACPLPHTPFPPLDALGTFFVSCLFPMAGTPQRRRLGLAVAMPPVQEQPHCSFGA